MPVKLCILNVPLCIFAILLVSFFQGLETSTGEKLRVYRQCLYWCSFKNCSSPYTVEVFKNLQPWYMSLLLWECEDECEYSCMWYAVQNLQGRGYSIPQFHGKWPFIRILGVQEPASAIFSILNGASHYLMWKKLKRAVPQVTGFNIWNMQALLSMNAWIWSSIFHTRDTPMTEKLDYYGAFSLVLFSFYSLIIKISSKMMSPLVISVPFLAFFTYHIYYLTFVKFDYGYNLKSNVIVGLMNSVGWWLWCYKNWYKPHVWKCALSILLVNLLLLLELGDFPPWRYFIDAHALWHLGTIPVPLLWYNFVIEECLYEKMKNQKQL